MPTVSDSFHSMLRGVRSGDSVAIGQFVTTYEPFLRRVIRIRLRRASLRAIIDSVDVTQSVFGSIFIRLSAGQFDFESEDDLLKLLSRVAHNKFFSIQRHELCTKRDRRCTMSIGRLTEVIDTKQHTADETLNYRELLQRFENRLRPTERDWFQQRQQGTPWRTIAERSQENENLLRLRYFRAVKRVAVELGLENG